MCNCFGALFLVISKIGKFEYLLRSRFIKRYSSKPQTYSMKGFKRSSSSHQFRSKTE